MNEDRKKRLDALFESFQIIAEGKYVFLCDIAEDYSRWSKRAVDFFGLPSNYMQNAGNIWAEHVHPEDREGYLKSIDDIFQGKQNGHDMRYRALDKDGKYVVCTCRGVVIRDNEGNPEYFGGAIQNHDQLSYIDNMTGLPSLYEFFEDLRAMFSKKNKGTILKVGLNTFANINVIYGYTFGNSVLRELGTLLRKEFNNCGVVYRMDGTKFAIISHTLSAEQLKTMYKRIQLKVSHRFTVEGRNVSLSMNAGIVVVDNFDINSEVVYSCLKHTYYESKNHKLGEAVIFEDTLTDDNRLYLEKLDVIRSSIANNCQGFYLCYQPIMDAHTEELKGMEALIRWRSERYGTVPPVQFISVLEQDILFPELGRWILRQAMLDGRRLLDKYPHFVMNVNLSYTQLEQANFVSEVVQLLAETGFPPENLCLEITERCRILDLELLKRMLGMFRDHGIKVALDDFGTGFSSLGILREVTVDTVKIDREYVKDVENSKSDQSTVQFIANLADSFSAAVCVEGVESAEMRDCLRQYRVSSLQGYYYSRPIPMEDFLRKYCRPAEEEE